MHSFRSPTGKKCTSPLQVFISNGWMADLVVVVAVTNPEAKTSAHGISLFLVENGMKGFHKGRKLEKIGLKAQVAELVGLGKLRLHLSSTVRKRVDSVFSRGLFLSFFQDTAELFFEDVRLPADSLLGEPNKGFYYLMNELPQVKGRPHRPVACKERSRHAEGLIVSFCGLGASCDCRIGLGELRVHV